MNTQPATRQVRVLVERRSNPLLGVHLVDAATGAPVHEGLRVTVHAASSAHLLAEPAVSASGFAAVHDARGAGGDVVVVRVHDAAGRYLPVRFEATLGTGLVGPTGTSSGAARPTTPLLPAPAAEPPAGWMGLRAHLTTPGGDPAAGAAFVAEVDGRTWVGFAGADGQVLTVVPTPGPPGTTVRVTVRYPVGASADASETPWRDDALDLDVALDQPLARLRTDLASDDAVAHLDVPLPPPRKALHSAGDTDGRLHLAPTS